MAACQSLLLLDVALLRDVETVQELCRALATVASPLPAPRAKAPGSTHLPDILVPHPANLLDVGSALRDGLERVTAEDELVLLSLRDLDIDTTLHHDPPDDLLTNEVATAHSTVSLVANLTWRPPSRESQHRPSRSQHIQSGWCSSIGTYRISTSQLPVSAFLSRLTLMGKWA